MRAPRGEAPARHPARDSSALPALYDEVKKDGWRMISMKNDWKRVFPFEQ
jgi:hypothetical protein